MKLNLPRTVIIGSSGMLGQELLSVCRAEGGCPVTFADSQALDLTDAPAVRSAMKDARPEVIINAAAYTNVDLAEAEHERARAEDVNHHAVGRLAEVARELGAVLVHYSTDYVFNGESTVPYPVDQPGDAINWYGETKRRGEEAIRAVGGEHLIIRASWLFAPHGRNFVKTIIDLAAVRGVLRVVTDQRGRPTLCADLAQMTCRLLRAGARGTFHGANEGDCSWFELAEAVVELAGLPCRVEPTVTAEFPRPARRPRFSVLDLSATTDRIGFGRHWRDALAECVDIILHDGERLPRLNGSLLSR